MPVLYLLTNSSQRLQHSQRGRRVSRAVLGRCWLRLICFVFFFFCVVIGSFPPFSRKGTTCLICPAHLTTDQRQQSQQEPELLWERLCRRISSCFYHPALQSSCATGESAGGRNTGFLQASSSCRQGETSRCSLELFIYYHLLTRAQSL